MGPKEPRRTEALQKNLRVASTPTVDGNQCRGKGGAVRFPKEGIGLSDFFVFLFFSLLGLLSGGSVTLRG